MGKGDSRTRRGKIRRGSHGNARSRKKEKERKKRRDSPNRGATDGEVKPA
jgi:ribosomal small subunit protein bTHX